MAKPDLDDGWFKLAYELLPPLMMCCHRVEASIVLCEVLAQTYGRGKRETARLKPAEIAEKTGQLRPNIWRGIKELTDNGIIHRLGDGTYRFEKDYEKWGTPGAALVPPQLAGYFAGFPGRAKRFEPESAPGPAVSKVDTPSKKANEKGVSRGDTVRVSKVDTPSTDANAASVSQEDTAGVSRGDTVRVSKVDTFAGSPPITPPSRRESIENGESSSTGRRDDRILDDEHEATIEHARRVFPATPAFAEAVTEMGLDIRRSTNGRWDCYRAAIDAAKRSRRHIGDLYLWCLRTAQQYAATGIPPAPIAVEPTVIVDAKGKPVLSPEEQAAERARRKASLMTPREPANGR